MITPASCKRPYYLKQPEEWQRVPLPYKGRAREGSFLPDGLFFKWRAREGSL
jgi:hypothetical protein